MTVGERLGSLSIVESERFPPPTERHNKDESEYPARLILRLSNSIIEENMCLEKIPIIFICKLFIFQA